MCQPQCVVRYEMLHESATRGCAASRRARSGSDPSALCSQRRRIIPLRSPHRVASISPRWHRALAPLIDAIHLCPGRRAPVRGRLLCSPRLVPAAPLTGAHASLNWPGARPRVHSPMRAVPCRSPSGCGLGAADADRDRQPARCRHRHRHRIASEPTALSLPVGLIHHTRHSSIEWDCCR